MPLFDDGVSKVLIAPDDINGWEPPEFVKMSTWQWRQWDLGEGPVYE